MKKTSPGDTSRPTILLVGGSVDDLASVASGLAAQGVLVSVAVDADAGLESARLTPPVLILLDPVASGPGAIEVCRGLKACAETRDIPLVLITSPRRIEDALADFKAGAGSPPGWLSELLARRPPLPQRAAHPRLVVRNPPSPGCRELLAVQVADRTAELQASNQQLRQQVVERQRVEAELRDSERRYRELFDNATDLILLLEVTTDGRFRCLEVNNAFERQLGLSRQKMLGSYVGSSVSAEAQKLLVAMYQRCLDVGKTIEEEFTIDVPVGRRSFQTTVVPLFDPSGQIYRLISIARDITERRRREALENTRLAVFEQLARGGALVNILELVVAYVEKNRAGYLCCIRLVSTDGKRLVTIAAPSLPADYNAALDELQIGDGIGSCGAAGWRGETVIAEDVRCHPYWVDYKDLALRAGLLSCWSLPIFDSIGKLLGTFGIYQRQTGLPSDDDREMMRQVGYLAAAAIERKQADECLQAREQEFRTLAENLPDHIVRYDRECRRTYLNSKMIGLLGAAPKRVLGKTPVESQPGGRAAFGDYEAKLRRVLASGEADEIELPVQVCGGETQIHHVRFVAERDGDGHVLGALAIGRDISERKRMELLLQAREQEFRTLAENSPDIIVRYDRNCRRIYVNPAHRKATGIPRELALHVPLAVRWRANVPVDEFEAHLRRTMESGQSTQILVAWQGADGRAHDYAFHLLAERNAEDRVVGALIIGRDITALQETERRLEKSEALLRQLAARQETAREDERKRIARELHDEMGQYLSALRLDISVLRMHYGEGNPLLLPKLQRMMDLVDNTIKVVREVVSSLRPAALDMGLVSALEWLAEEFSRRTRIQCELRVDDEGIEFDEDRAIVVFRIVQESLTNVSRHAEASWVLISLRLAENYFVLSIADNGKGFDPTHRKEKAFGLIGIEERAIMLGGKLNICSAPGGGTSIFVSLPTHSSVPGENL